MSHSLQIEKSMPSSTTPFKRWTDLHPRYKTVFEIFKQSEIKALGLLAVSLVTGLIAREELSFKTVSDWFVERTSGLLGVDTGPTTLNPLIEGASALSFLGSLGYVVGGRVYDKIFKGTLRKQGLEPLPKNWKDHTLVVDVTRGIFDAIEELRPNNEVVLVHDGRLIKEGDVEGGSLNSKTRRNLNSVGIEHLSDADFLSRMNPEKAREIFINLCSMDSILGSAAGKEDHLELPISLEKTLNILMTLKNYLNTKTRKGAGPKIKLLIPEALNTNHTLSLIIELVGANLDIEFSSPERIFVEEVNNRVENGIDFVTDIEKLPPTLKSIGLKINSKSEKIFVYKSTDDKTIFEAAKIKKLRPKTTVIACIERKTNIDEAEAIADFVWELPSLVAQKI